MFTGSLVALITPMLSDGSVDYPSLRRLVEFHVAKGTAGIVAVGTTGESPTLPVHEHTNVVAKVIEFARGRVPVIAGSGANSTEEALELGEKCAAVGAQALLSVVPYYNKPQDRGLIAHFEAIADAAPVPVILYNVPGRTITDISDEAVIRLSQHKNIIGIKDATGNIERLTQLKPRVTDGFLFFSGDDESCCEFMLRGGHGVVSVTANIVPAEMSAMCKAAISGDRATAFNINTKIGSLHTTLFVEPNPVVPKYALYKMGLVSSPKLRLPLVGAELSSQQSIEAAMRDIGLL